MFSLNFLRGYLYCLGAKQFRATKLVLNCIFWSQSLAKTVLYQEISSLIILEKTRNWPNKASYKRNCLFLRCLHISLTCFLLWFKAYVIKSYFQNGRKMDTYVLNASNQISVLSFWVKLKNFGRRKTIRNTALFMLQFLFRLHSLSKRSQFSENE